MECRIWNGVFQSEITSEIIFWYHRITKEHFNKNMRLVHILTNFLKSSRTEIQVPLSNGFTNVNLANIDLLPAPASLLFQCQHETICFQKLHKCLHEWIVIRESWNSYIKQHSDILSQQRRGEWHYRYSGSNMTSLSRVH